MAKDELTDPAVRWSLILGEETTPGGDPRSAKIGRALDFVYALDPTRGYRAKTQTKPGAGGKSSGGDLSASAPYLPNWLEDVRSCFPEGAVHFLQLEALQRRGLKQILFEPETLEKLAPDLELVTTLLGFKDMVPDRTRETARMVVRRVVEELEERLRLRLEQALTGHTRTTRTRLVGPASQLDFRRTIRANLSRYVPELGTIVPEHTYYFENQQQRLGLWTVIVLVDQSGSMAESVVHASVVASILASLKSVKTHVIFFDTAVVDMTGELADPVDLLFGAKLGGGTDIARALGYATGLVTEPERTVLVLVTDLYEGGSEETMKLRLAHLLESRVRCLCLLGVNDGGHPAYDARLANVLAEMGVHVFPASPEQMVDAVVKLLGEAAAPPPGSMV